MGGTTVLEQKACAEAVGMRKGHALRLFKHMRMMYQNGLACKPRVCFWGPGDGMCAVSAMLAEMNLEQYEQYFEEEGYDNMDIFVGINDVEIQTCAEAVQMKPGHALKFVKELDVGGFIDNSLWPTMAYVGNFGTSSVVHWKQLTPALGANLVSPA